MGRGGLRIGITVTPGAPGLAWLSGVHQNAVFLAETLLRTPGVAQVSMAVCGGPSDGHPLAEAAGVGAIPAEAAAEQLDVLIELAARAPEEDMARLKAAGGRRVSYMAGNVMAMNFEALANGTPYGDEVLAPGSFDACWITPQHWRMCRSYGAMTRSTRTRLAPHVWSPTLFEAAARALNADPHWRGPPEGAWRIGVFEPTVNVVKTFHLPLLVCEAAYRLRPELIDRVLMFGTERLKGVPHFEEFCAATDLARDGKLFAEARFALPEVLGRHLDAVVAHQWENELNYLYWDVLQSRRPLIHNADAIRQAGYWYEAFNPEAGGQALIRALESHAPAPDVTEATLYRFSPQNPAVTGAYAALLDELYA